MDRDSATIPTTISPVPRRPSSPISPSIEAHWIDERDAGFNPLGIKGIGEIGIVGTAAAIGNAVYHATGARIRELPMVPERVLAALG